MVTHIWHMGCFVFPDINRLECDRAKIVNPHQGFTHATGEHYEDEGQFLALLCSVAQILEFYFGSVVQFASSNSDRA